MSATADLDITCQCQRDIKVSLTWCVNAQYQQLCRGCAHNEGRTRSRYQQNKERESSTDKGNRI